MRVNHPFTICVHTGQRRLSGTNANVYIKLYDELGQASPDFQLDSPNDDFEKGHVDTFSIVVPGEVFGNPAKIKIWHDNTGDHPGWFLKFVEIKDPYGFVGYFEFNDWIAKDHSLEVTIDRKTGDPVLPPSGSDFHL